MADEPQLHDLTKLLLTRLESNPEEFSRESHLKAYKWHKAVEAVREHGAKVDKETLNAALHEHYMGVGLETALKLLLNGDEDGVGLRSTKHPAGNAAGLSSWPPGPYNGGSGGFNSLQHQQARQLTTEEIQAMLAQQQTMLAQQTVKNLVSQAKAQQKPTVTIPTYLAKAAGLKPMTAKEQIEHWIKRLGL